MTQEHFQTACDKTFLLLQRQNPGTVAERSPGNETRPCHLAWMVVSAGLFHLQGKTDKANRWLGFVQGSMAADGYATVEELKRANMPEGEAFDPGKV